MKRFSRRNFNPLNLSFLDIMSCGLGAVILIFLIIKHGESEDSLDLDNAVSNLESENQELELKIDSLKALELNITKQKEINSLELKNTNSAINTVSSNTESVEKRNKDLEKEVSELEESMPDIIEIQDDGERQYLTGLKVEGDNILFLLDTSASMLDEKIVNIIRRSVLLNHEDSKKWIRAKDSLTWLISRLPEGSSMTIVTFGENALSHTNRAWIKSSDVSEIKKALNSATSSIPSGGTNLERALIEAKKIFPLPDAAYIITDGLPTKGEKSKSLRNSTIQRGCFKESPTISSDCRHVLFQQAKDQYLEGKRIKTSTILLPLEGDVRAASDYWNLALQSNGTLISPARDWP